MAGEEERVADKELIVICYSVLVRWSWLIEFPINQLTN
jgi:hypothetical protein